MARLDRKPATRRRILRAALREFGRHGLDRTRMGTVSERAGVAKGTVFLHFKSKASLYVAVVAHAADEFHAGVVEAAEVPGASFMDVVDGQIEFLRRHPDIDAVLSSLRGEHPWKEVREAARAAEARHVALWRRWIADRQPRAGPGREPGADSLARLAAATVAALLATRSTDPGIDVREILAHFGALVEAGLDGGGRAADARGRARGA